MVDQTVLAHLHVSTVLQNLEDVLNFDKKAMEIARGWNHVIQFSCPGGIGAHIEFSNGKARHIRGVTTLPTIALWFPTAKQLNNMFLGKKFSLAIPWMGAWNISLLKGFTELSKRMEHCLKPSDVDLKNKQFFEFHVKCLLNTAVFGLKAIGENDPKVRPIIQKSRNGIAEFRIKNGPAAHIVIKEGHLFPFKGSATDPDVTLELKNYKTAYGLFSGKLDAMALMGTTDLRVEGYIPIIDNLNAALDRLGIYLN